MYKKLISVRISIDEFDALSKLAGKEIRSVSSWLRSRIVLEAQKAGLLNSSHDCKKDNLPETPEMITKEDDMTNEK